MQNMDLTSGVAGATTTKEIYLIFKNNDPSYHQCIQSYLNEKIYIQHHDEDAIVDDRAYE